MTKFLQAKNVVQITQFLHGILVRRSFEPRLRSCWRHGDPNDCRSWTRLWRNVQLDKQARRGPVHIWTAPVWTGGIHSHPQVYSSLGISNSIHLPSILHSLPSSVLLLLPKTQRQGNECRRLEPEGREWPGFERDKTQFVLYNCHGCNDGPLRATCGGRIY